MKCKALCIGVSAIIACSHVEAMDPKEEEVEAKKKTPTTEFVQIVQASIDSM